MQLGKVPREHGLVGRQQRQLRRRPGAHLRLRGVNQVRGVLARFLVPTQGTRALRCAARRGRDKMRQFTKES